MEPQSTTSPTATLQQPPRPTPTAKSSFLTPGPVTQPSDLVSLHLRRDSCLPVVLSTTPLRPEESGYAEGAVTNTRFGSFPHSTLIGVAWGSQVRASRVDTGTRGQQGRGRGKKRKRGVGDGEMGGEMDGDGGGGGGVPLKEAVVASTGFLHVLPPTPESWTLGLPHRTQVVYTPDYSYVLHRLRVRPGSVVVEAGGGSGSFTHAAARAVFSGYGPAATSGGSEANGTTVSRRKGGKVFTYEFHAERYAKLAKEMQEHGLEGVVTATHRDVYREGFLLQDKHGQQRASPGATAVFLDLPAPWEALPHLTRQASEEQPSALDPDAAVHLCAFSPCIEQVQRTVSALRKAGWLDIEMVEMQHRRIDVRREYTGYEYDGMRGVNGVARDVREAVRKLREQEERALKFQAHSTAAAAAANQNDEHDDDGEDAHLPPRPATGHAGPDDADEANPQRTHAAIEKTFFQEGRVVHRSEPELRTHTSYLVFAVLAREWSEADEERARRELGSVIARPWDVPKSQTLLKKEAKRRLKLKGGRDVVEVETEGNGGGDGDGDVAMEGGEGEEREGAC